jgi:hypothetical protein
VRSGVSVEAAVVTIGRLARTVVVAQCQSREMDVKENNMWRLNFAVKPTFRLQRLWN